MILAGCLKPWIKFFATLSIKSFVMKRFEASFACDLGLKRRSLGDIILHYNDTKNYTAIVGKVFRVFTPLRRQRIFLPWISRLMWWLANFGQGICCLLAWGVRIRCVARQWWQYVVPVDDGINHWSYGAKLWNWLLLLSCMSRQYKESVNMEASDAHRRLFIE